MKLGHHQGFIGNSFVKAANIALDSKKLEPENV